MKITVKREQLLKPLQHIASVVERRQTLPILSNTYLNYDGTTLRLTGTDLEVEVITGLTAVEGSVGETTVGARKLLDICRALPDGADLQITAEGDKATVRSGRSRFVLQTLPASDFPNIETEAWEREFSIGTDDLHALLERTAFAMAQQDVRYYLNGLLLDIDAAVIRGVATDGHRLAKSEVAVSGDGQTSQQAIVPRKAIQELLRFLGESEGEANIKLNPNHMRVEIDDITFTTKLIDGRYPDYEKVLPRDIPVALQLDKAQFRDTLSRAAILTNEKFRGVKIELSKGQMKVTAHNPEQEEANDEMVIDYDGAELEVGFNVSYLIDAINALPGESVQFNLKDQNSSCVLRTAEDEKTFYLVMPMRL